nr:MAG TPA: hypothetical protein [Caudoviricetes sp.]
MKFGCKFVLTLHIITSSLLIIRPWQVPIFKG